MAKDRKPEDGATRGTASPAGGVSRAGGNARAGSGRGGKGGRTRPARQVVAQPRPWGLIAAAVVVVLFAAAAIGYAVVKVNEANAEKVESIDEIAGAKTYDYAAGQEHVTTPVEYPESPPVGGAHDGEWADCTGTVYDVDIRHENAVHSMEHGAVWITYNPDQVSDADVATLAALVDGTSGRMLSPYADLDSPISLQAWNTQLKLDSADDKRAKQFADLMTFKANLEPGASCENPMFIADPLVVGDGSRGTEGMTDSPTTTTPATGAPETATP
ncbi:MAG: hypothetical protein JWQ45_993 [Blastococcus sp.]|nr:hypothetical protein [Blastococcus sp.]